MLYAKIKDKIKITYFFLITFIFCLPTKSASQLFDAFTDGDLSMNPSWFGNTDHFIVNDQLELQLNAPATGESFLYTAYTLPGDSIEMDLYFKMTFEPSDNNFSIIYLGIDNVNPAIANGYYIKLGENGATDQIRFFKLDAGASTLIASGNLGSISKDPAQARMKIKISPQGIWTVETDYHGGTLFSQELSFLDSDLFNLSPNVYFGIYCKYTSTRLKNFFFDDISIKKWEPDTIAPLITGFEVIDARTIEIKWSELLDPSTALDKNNYIVDQGLMNPNSILFGPSENIVVLSFSKDIESGLLYSLSISNIKDLAGNIRALSYSFTRAVSPEPGDLILNEILTDPFLGGEDFIELYNKSVKFIQLRNIIIRNASKDEEKLINSNFILKPGEHLGISKNIATLKSLYAPPSDAIFLENQLPTLNVSDAYLQIIKNEAGKRTIVDSFEYFESYHYILLRETKGVSLERILPDGPSNNANNWHSASQSVGFATPGYRNSNFNPQEPEDQGEVVLSNKIFSPYAPGFDPFLLIQFSLKKNGYLATIQIYDAEGFPVRRLANNLLLGLDSIIKWDGFTEDGGSVKMGWYVVATRLFHPDGEIKEYKHSVAVGDQW